MNRYRDGGRGMGNALTAEVFQGLSNLPRDLFLGEILSCAHGAEQTRLAAANEVEHTALDVLPGSQMPGNGAARDVKPRTFHPKLRSQNWSASTGFTAAMSRKSGSKGLSEPVIKRELPGAVRPPTTPAASRPPIRRRLWATTRPEMVETRRGCSKPCSTKARAARHAVGARHPRPALRRCRRRPR